MSPDTAFYQQLSKMGLTKNISLISIFTMSYVNQSKYVGISGTDGFQYFTIRSLPFLAHFFIIFRADLNGTLIYHFE